MKRVGIFAFIIWLLSSTSCQTFANEPTYDGRWWLSIEKEQQEGFADGYIACYLYDVKGNIKFEYTGQMYAPKVTEYLKSHPTEQTKSVEALLWTVTIPPNAPPARRNIKGNGEVTPGKYGIFDGEFWREISNHERLGFVQGFLYCFSTYKGIQKGKFSKPASEYVKAISSWYEVLDNDGSAINDKKVPEKIPNVLFKFADTGAE